MCKPDSGWFQCKMCVTALTVPEQQQQQLLLLLFCFVFVFVVVDHYKSSWHCHDKEMPPIHFKKIEMHLLPDALASVRIRFRLVCLAQSSV